MAKLYYVVVVMASFLLASAATAVRPETYAHPPLALVPDPGDAEAEKELMFQYGCLKRLGNCSDALFDAFENHNNIEDPLCCWKLTRMSRDCWRFVIVSYADQCHVLPDVMKRCKEIVPNAVPAPPPPPPAAIVKSPES